MTLSAQQQFWAALIAIMVALPGLITAAAAWLQSNSRTKKLAENQQHLADATDGGVSNRTYQALVEAFTTMQQTNDPQAAAKAAYAAMIVHAPGPPPHPQIGGVSTVPQHTGDGGEPPKGAGIASGGTTQ